ncbi:DUF1987 domain-containing protein [Rhizobiales bacterium]|uniref:DUF1987 domain-containing protein n=1 Tax=Hongsoonwoonella zoysiae TaxID=2821844 RepID=UPI00155FEAC4|nr:DUF1987 domain-containing protein [Hongsoonwoonella zoysiae]NRG17086.1 DUF1987 domain-containing protein [Hongsoonwoonella zoysiae]
MENLEIPASTRTPAVAFDFARHHLKISGESYPEDVTSFYTPLFDALDIYLEGRVDGSCRFDFELIYFNSSSAKAIMMLMEKLDEAAKAGMNVDVHWFYDPQDETMHELGEEFGEDLQHAAFHLESIPRR